MFLAIYDQANLLCPSKVLTYAEDIGRELSELGVACSRFEPEPGQASLDDDARLSSLMERLPPPAFPHWRLLELEGAPGYVDPSDALTEPVQVCSEAARWAFLSGRGQLCLVSTGALSVIELGPGDIIDFPAGMQHWLRPAPAERCVIMHMAPSIPGLDRRSARRDLSERFPGFGS